MTTDHDLITRLADEMHREVDDRSWGTARLGDIRAGAARVRRRRRRATGVAAALAVVALLVPVGVLAGGFDRSGETLAPAPEPSSPTEPARPSGPVTLDPDAPAGPGPALPYLDGRRLVDGDTVLEVGADYNDLVRAGDEWVAVRQGDPGIFVDVLDADGDVVETSQTTAEVAGSADGRIGAWVTPAGEVLARADGETVALGTVSGRLRAVEVLGRDSCDETVAPDGCVVYLDDPDGGTPQAVTSTGDVERVPGGFTALRAVSPEGLLAGQVSEGDPDPSVPVCSAVYDPASGGATFESCRLAFSYAAAGFSADGRWIVGTGDDDAEGAGPRRVAVIDARSGETVVDARLPGSRPADPGTIAATAWEDAEHLLVKVGTTDADGLPTYQLYRVGLDGTVERLLADAGQAQGEVQPWIFAE